MKMKDKPNVAFEIGILVGVWSALFWVGVLGFGLLSTGIAFTIVIVLLLLGDYYKVEREINE